MSMLQRIVDNYILNHRGNANDEMSFFKKQPSLLEAIRLAGLAIAPNGKRHSHQLRIPQALLDESCIKLLGKIKDIQSARTFDNLYSIISSAISPINGIGELTVYDTALRIGAFLNLEPTSVYLHRGTRVGARRLGFDANMQSIDFKYFPKELRSLKPSEVEDVLCIYKEKLQYARSV